MASPLVEKFNRLPLAQKILAPVFLVLILLGLIATVGAMHQAQAVLSEHLEQNLLDHQATIEQAIKAEEQRLRTHVALLSALYKNQTAISAEKKDLFNNLPLDDLTPSLLNEDAIAALDNEQLQQLFAHARKSGKPRVRFFSALQDEPVLTIVSRIPTTNGEDWYIMIQRNLGHKFLREMMKPIRSTCYLYDRNGTLLAGNREEIPAPPLGQTEVAALVQGGLVAKSTNTHRLHFFAIPLGTTDLMLMAVSLPTHGLEDLANSLATHSAIMVVIVLLLFGYLFYKYIRSQLQPVTQLLQATEAVSNGNLEYRIPPIREDELGRLAKSFNDMVSQLSSLCLEKAAKERLLTTHQEELKYKGLLEAKNTEIERANHELRAHLKEMSALFQLNQAMTSTLELDILFERMLNVLKDLIHCDRIVLFTYNPGGEELIVRKTYGIDQELLKGITFSLNEGITGKAALTKELIYVENLKTEERNLGYKGKSNSGGSMVAMPLVIKKRLAGVLNLHKTETSAFSKGELQLIQAIANQAAIAIDNSQLYEKARNLSNTDELTGLANRRHFQMILKREVAQAQRFHSHFSLIMADIDHFKNFNDTHGHLRGDIVLKKVADILLQNTRGIDLVGRFGGEEFIILLPKTDKEGARAAAEKLRACIMADTFSGEAESQPGGTLTLSLGIAQYPADSKDIYELLDLADRALYRAKEEGRNQVATWKVDMQAAD